MRNMFCRVLSAQILLGVISFLPASAGAATPTIDQALKLTPVQKDVDYDIPAPADIAKCTIKAEKVGNQTGWVVRGPNGQILREFVDTNGDNVVDRWSYFKDGIEVYRDIDENFNGKADQHRWLNTAGSRWGLDPNEDGKIDSWKSISPEEVTAEVVMAIRDKDAGRFNRLLLTPGEAKSLGLGAAKTKDLLEKVTGATSKFSDLIHTQHSVTPNTQWEHFGGSRPGLVPAGTDGATADIIAYENVMAMTETDGKDGQVSVGTLIKVGDVWRVIDAPTIPDPNSKLAEVDGFFFQTASRASDTTAAESNPDGPSEKVQKMMDELSKLDEAVGKASTEAEQTRLNDRRVELMLGIIDEVGEKDRAQWIRQFADAVSAAAQTGMYPGGVEKLQTMLDTVEKSAGDSALAPYVKYRLLTAGYGSKLQKGDEFVKVQAEWLDNLEKFVQDYPKASDTAEALLQLGIAQEFAGQEEKARKWYGQLVSDFESTASATKARGALNRMDSVGKPMQLRSKMVTGQAYDIAKEHGKYVLVHYWSTWCEPCKTDFAELKELYAKYGKSGFTLVGVNVDTNLADANEYLSKNRLPWPQLWEPGGLDSRLANDMGILTLPTMILVDDKGNVINRSVHITELETELRSHLKNADSAGK
ncbi:MAG TPA: thioredoxin-like domain-containing protein [Pirellulales bacterium]|nr:thioredoxin-like domain-containing protein [Pirellulales bacterium]